MLHFTKMRERSMKLSEAIALRTKKLLVQKGITMYKLEKISTIPHGTMIDLMAGTYKSVNFRTIMLIIKALEIKTSEFFNDEIFESENLEIL